MRKARAGGGGGGGEGADTISGMWLLLAESGRGEVGRAERSSWVAEFRELSVALTCARWSHPPSCPHLMVCPAVGFRGALRQRAGRPPSSGIFKDV